MTKHDTLATRAENMATFTNFDGVDSRERRIFIMLYVYDCIDNGKESDRNVTYPFVFHTIHVDTPESD